MSRSGNPRVFVTGCTRSGTTLLQRMLDNHPDLVVSNDTHVIPRSVLSARPDPSAPMTMALADEVTRYKSFPKLDIDAHDVEDLATKARTFTEFVRLLFDELARRRGKPFAGEKDPEYVRRLARIGTLFPAVRFLHIVRDGRDVALSTLEWVTPRRFLGQLELWETEPVAVCALWWRRQVSAGRTGGRQLHGDRYLELLYEDLVAAPEESLRNVVRFLDLPFREEMLAFHRGRTSCTPGLSSKQQWLPPTPALRDWSSAMAEEDVVLFEALAGDLLGEFGYPVVSQAASTTIAERAQRCRAWWEANVGPIAPVDAISAPASGVAERAR